MTILSLINVLRNVRFVSGSLLLLGGRWQIIWTRHRRCSLQGLSLCRNRHKWHQWRGDAWSGNQSLAFFFLFLFSSNEKVLMSISSWFHFKLCIFAVGVSSWSMCRNLVRRPTLGCSIYTRGKISPWNLWLYLVILFACFVFLKISFILYEKCA